MPLQVELVRKGHECFWASLGQGGWCVHLRDCEWITRHKYTKNIIPELLRFFDLGIKRATLYLEDLVFVVPPPRAMGVGLWNVVSFDVVSGQIANAIWTTKELRACLELAIGGDDSRTDLYSILEPLVKDWPKECRPIP